MVEYDTRPAFKWIARELGMSVRQTGELRSVAILALIVAEFFKIRLLAVVFLVACSARNFPFVRMRCAGNERSGCDGKGRVAWAVFLEGGNRQRLQMRSRKRMGPQWRLSHAVAVQARRAVVMRGVGARGGGQPFRRTAGKTGMACRAIVTDRTVSKAEFAW